jgi:hypothetical protein
MAAMVNPANDVDQRAIRDQYQAQISQYINHSYTSFFSQLYGVGGLVDTVA